VPVGVGELYAEERRRISDLVLALASEEADCRVPTCPRWTVGDVVSHLVGVCADVLAGNVGGVATEPWTAEQVRARRGRRLAELVDEWSDVGPQVEAFADNFPGMTGVQWVTDITTHEHDIRTAVGRPGARDSQGVEVGLNFLVMVGLDSAVSARGLPPLVVQAGERSWVVGTGEAIAIQNQEEVAQAADERLMAALLSGGPPAERSVPDGMSEVLVAPPFELFRALTGRRSAAQIRLLDWSIDPAPYLPAFQFGPFTLSAADVAE
jgi:uncharacterized protein (TIGR03083 family)